MATELAFAVGERVRLLKLEDWFYSGMNDEDVARLKTMVGQIWTVEAHVEESGDYELVFEHPRGSPSPLEWVWVPPSWIGKLSANG